MPEFLIRQAEAEDRRNAKVSASASAAHLKELTRIVYAIVRGTEHPFALSDFAMKAIQRGMPVRKEALISDEYVLRMEAHYMALVLPNIPKWMAIDARKWLAFKLKKAECDVEGGIPFNLAVGGETINPSGE